VILDTRLGSEREQPILIETRAAKLGDYVWYDLNADGIQGVTEQGIDGVTVNLWRDLNGNNNVDVTKYWLQQLPAITPMSREHSRAIISLLALPRALITGCSSSSPPAILVSLCKMQPVTASTAM